MGLMTARIGHAMSSSTPLRTAGFATTASAGVIATQYAWGEDFGSRQSTPSWHNHVVGAGGAIVGAGTWFAGGPAGNSAAIIGGAVLGAYLVAPMVRRALAE